MTEPAKTDKRIYVLSEEKPLKAVVKLGVPLIAGMFIMVLYNLTDTFFIGFLKDDYQLAAVNFAYPVMMVTIAISNMIGTGASSLIARSLGADQKDKAEHTVTSNTRLFVIQSHEYQTEMHQRLILWCISKILVQPFLSFGAFETVLGASIFGFGAFAFLYDTMFLIHCSLFLRKSYTIGTITKENILFFS